MRECKRIIDEEEWKKTEWSKTMQKFYEMGGTNRKKIEREDERGKQMIEVWSQTTKMT